MNMRELSVDTILDNINPAIYNVNILYWCELIEQNEYNNIILFGDEIDNELFCQRFAKYNIPILKRIDYYLNEKEDDTKNKFLSNLSKYVVIVTFRDFPGNPVVFNRVMRELKRYRVNKPYIIHDFSAGFALGTELIKQEQNEIREAYQHLSDEHSKKIFLTTLQKATQPYGWNMDFNNENFGIPDKNVDNIYNCEDNISILDNLDTVLYCTTKDINNNSKVLKAITKCTGLIAFIPNNITRRRFREYLIHQSTCAHFQIIKQILWSDTKIINYECELPNGGTPLKFKKKKEILQAITIDRFVEEYYISTVSHIVAEMNTDYIFLLNGANKTIHKYQPEIDIIGFHEIDGLWKAINHLFKKYGNEYSIHLSREPRENILEGHIIILKKKGHIV